MEMSPLQKGRTPVRTQLMKAKKETISTWGFFIFPSPKKPKNCNEMNIRDINKGTAALRSHLSNYQGLE